MNRHTEFRERMEMARVVDAANQAARAVRVACGRHDITSCQPEVDRAVTVAVLRAAGESGLAREVGLFELANMIESNARAGSKKTEN